MKGRAVVSMVLLAVASLLAFACTPEAPQAQQTFAFKYASDSPPPEVNPYTAAQNAWLLEVEKRSNGRIKFERYWSQALVPSAEQLQAVSAGVADVSTLLTSFWPAKLPLSNVAWLPGIIEDTWAAEMSLRDLIKTNPAFKKELEDQNNVKYVTSAAVGPYGVLSVRPLNKLADLKGLTVVTLGGGQSDWIKAMGGVPVYIPTPDRYDALQKGTVQAVTGQPVAIGVFKYHELAKNYWDIQLGGGVHYIAMNLDAWKKLPPDLQKLIEDTDLYGVEQAALKFQYEGFPKMINETLRPAGVQFIKASPEDIAEAKRVAKDIVWEKWVKDMDAKGLPGRQVFDAFVQGYRKYEAQSPYKGKFSPSVLDY